MSKQRIRLRPLAISTGALFLALGLLMPAPPAPARTGKPDIIGGVAISSAPWAAALFRDGQYHCAGSIVAPSWVLTASHCVGGDVMEVRVGSAFLHSGGVVAEVKDVATSPDGDMSLLQLDHAVDTTYSPLASRMPRVGSEGSIYGWGKTSLEGRVSGQLREATVRVTSTRCRDLLGGRAICSAGVTGVAWGGDSGGPQFADGLQVGVASTANGTTSQTYGAIAANRDWIRSVAGA